MSDTSAKPALPEAAVRALAEAEERRRLAKARRCRQQREPAPLAGSQPLDQPHEPDNFTPPKP